MIFAVASFGRAAANRTASSWKQTCAPENGAALGRRTRSGPRLPVAVHAPPSLRLLAEDILAHAYAQCRSKGAPGVIGHRAVCDRIDCGVHRVPRLMSLDAEERP